MKYILINANFVNRLPVITPAIVIGDILKPAVIKDGIEITPAVLAEAKDVRAKKYTFECTAFISIEGTPDGEFIQAKDFKFTTESLATAEDELLVKASEIVANYNYVPDENPLIP